MYKKSPATTEVTLTIPGFGRLGSVVLTAFTAITNLEPSSLSLVYPSKSAWQSDPASHCPTESPSVRQKDYIFFGVL